MAVPISNVTRRQVYAPSGSGGVGPYAFTFEILANTDIAVFKDNTLLTLTTHYTVTINANGTGSVTITAAGLALSPTSPTQYAVVGNRTIARSTDFTTGGDFFANTINDELDQQTIFAQQNAEGLQRALIAPQTDPTTINMTLPAKATRASKTLTFDVDGNPSAGVSAADVANAVTYATNAANSATAAASSASSASSSASAASSSASTASTQASNASTSASSAATQASNASTSATNAATSASTATTQATNASTSASNASTSATNAASSASAASTSASNASASASSAASAQTAAEAARDSALAAYDNFDDRYLGPYASNPTVDNDGNTLLAGALYFNTVVPEMRLWTGSAWVAAYVSGSGFIAATGGTMTGPLNFPDGSAAAPSITNDGDTNTGIFFPAADTIAFAEGGAEAMRIDSDGDVGIGTTSPAAKLHISVASAAVDGTKGVRITNPAGTVAVFECGSSGDSFIGTTSGSDFNIRTGNTVRATFDNAGNLLVGTTSTTVGGGGSGVFGFRVDGANGIVQSAASGNATAIFNRTTNDGTIVSLRQDGTEEGTISVSGTTVSYSGGHLSRYAQTTAPKDELIFKGTVLSNLDEMNVYTKDGQPVANEQLNKVKVSDTEGDANVAGVFVNWTHDEDHDVDEINMAMTGDMIIRIAQGVTVVRGDLLMSAGDGTAKPQGDDIVRSKTVAKVTSTHVTCTYADGSYCVPCVLMAC